MGNPVKHFRDESKEVVEKYGWFSYMQFLQSGETFLYGNGDGELFFVTSAYKDPDYRPTWADARRVGVDGRVGDFIRVVTDVG